MHSHWVQIFKIFRNCTECWIRKLKQHISAMKVNQNSEHMSTIKFMYKYSIQKMHLTQMHLPIWKEHCLVKRNRFSVFVLSMNKTNSSIACVRREKANSMYGTFSWISHSYRCITCQYHQRGRSLKNLHRMQMPVVVKKKKKKH